MSVKFSKDDWRYILILIWMILNTVLVISGHGQIQLDVNRLDSAISQTARQCQVVTNR